MNFIELGTNAYDVVRVGDTVSILGTEGVFTGRGGAVVRFRVVPADPANPPDPRDVAAIEKAISVETGGV